MSLMQLRKVAKQSKFRAVAIRFGVVRFVVATHASTLYARHAPPRKKFEI